MADGTPSGGDAATEPGTRRPVAGSELVAGARIGRFVLTRHLGDGGMGTVHEARDPELGRAVAIKLLRDQRADPTRLLREAQALATLSHPNVVAVYELGSHDGKVFIAMELIEGVSLDRYLATGDHGWREILALFVQAGRGLGAVHARDLVHRDFKPSNLLIDGEGRVRVSDFGLARLDRGGAVSEGATSSSTGGRASAELDETVGATAGDAVTDEDRAAAGPTPAPPSGAGRLLASPLTAAGAVIGTPRYMAPEQHRGGRVTRQADQFAFCVALWEGVYGEHPFGGDDVASLRAAVIAGQRRPAPRRRGVPSWLERALVRGLAVDPEARWPSIDAVVDTLERTPRRRRALALGGAGAVVIGAALAAVAVGGGGRGDPCPDVAAPIDRVWHPARAAGLRAGVIAADPAQGATRWKAIEGALDRHAGQWRSMAIDVCRANRVTHRESDSLHDARVACLDRRLAELRATTAALVAATGPAAVDRAVVEVARLPPLDACADAVALLALVPPPEDPARRRAVDAITADADAIMAALRIGDHAGLPDRGQALVARARATDHPPALARALWVNAEIAFATTGGGGAIESLRELTEVAAGSHDDDLAAWAWTRLLQEVGQGQGKPDEALALLPVARATVKRAGDEIEARVTLLTTSGMVLHLAGRTDDGQAALAEARTLILDGGPPASELRTAALLGDLEYQVGTIEQARGRYDLAEPAFRSSIALTTAAYGGQHPETAITWQALGESLRWQGKPDEALAAYQTGVDIRAARGGESPVLASALISLAAAHQALGRHDEALAALARAVRIFRAAGAASRRDLAVAMMTEGLALGGLGRVAEAGARYDEAIAIFETLDGRDSNHGITLFNRGELATKSGDCAAALPDFRRALELFAASLGDAHPYLVYPLSAIGACQVSRGDHAAAIATLDRALAIPVGAGQTVLHVKARFDRARALVESGRDRAGGLAAARAARAEMVTTPGAAELVAPSDAWLRTQRR